MTKQRGVEVDELELPVKMIFRLMIAQKSAAYSTASSVSDMHLAGGRDLIFRHSGVSISLDLSNEA
jgi:hypothetical protein